MVLILMRLLAKIDEPLILTYIFMKKIALIIKAIIITPWILLFLLRVSVSHSTKFHFELLIIIYAANP